MERKAPSGKFFDFTGEPVTRPVEVRIGTIAIIFNGRGEILLEKRSDNSFWGLPGGGVDVGESIEQTIVREVLEETGLQVRVKRLVGLYSDPAYYSINKYPDGKVVQTVTACFECKRMSGELRISNESTDIRYFLVDDLPDNLLLSLHQPIQDAISNKVEPYIR